MNGFHDYLECLRGRFKVLEWTVSPLEEDLRPKPVALPQRRAARSASVARAAPAWVPVRRKSSLVSSAIAVTAALGILLLWLFGPARASPSTEQVRPPPAAPASVATPQAEVEAETEPVVSAFSVPRPTATPPRVLTTPTPLLASSAAPAGPIGLARSCGQNRVPLFPQGMYDAEASARIREDAGQLGTYSERFKLVSELKSRDFTVTDIRVYATPGSSTQILDYYRRALVGADCMIERDLGNERLIAFRDLRATFTVTIAPFSADELAELGVPFEGYLLILAERSLVQQR